MRGIHCERSDIPSAVMCAVTPTHCISTALHLTKLSLCRMFRLHPPPPIHQIYYTSIKAGACPLFHPPPHWCQSAFNILWNIKKSLAWSGGCVREWNGSEISHPHVQSLCLLFSHCLSVSSPVTVSYHHVAVPLAWCPFLLAGSPIWPALRLIYACMLNLRCRLTSIVIVLGRWASGYTIGQSIGYLAMP